MPRMETDTKSEIRGVAADLFASQGFEKTSLREIAEQLGITKAALYYHYASKTDLLSDIVTPFVEETETFLDGAEGRAPRAILEGYFDIVYRHRDVYRLFLADISVLARLDLIGQVLGWRARLVGLFFGPDATPAQTARATVAAGGLQDCVVLDGPVEEMRGAALDAALAALGTTTP